MTIDEFRDRFAAALEVLVSGRVGEALGLLRKLLVDLDIALAVKRV